MTMTSKRAHRLLALALLSLGFCLALLSAGCDGSTDETSDDQTTSSMTAGETESDSASSGDVDAVVGKSVRLGDVQVTVNVLQATFQPAFPGQRISEQTPSAPAAGESFYQAYVRVENLGTAPARVDATDFTCVVDNTILPIEVTRSGPPARSILKNSSFDLILTFKAPAGFVPELRYDPPWYHGTLRVTPAPETPDDSSGSSEVTTGGD
jgi:hypothetical protein